MRGPCGQVSVKGSNLRTIGNKSQRRGKEAGKIRVSECTEALQFVHMVRVTERRTSDSAKAAGSQRDSTLGTKGRNKAPSAGHKPTVELLDRASGSLPCSVPLAPSAEKS